MLRHEWTRAFIENFAPGATLRTFVARAGRELHAALPLIESRDRAADTCFLPMTTWAMPSNDHSQRGGMLLGRRSEEGLRAIWEQLMDTPGWDRLRLRDLPDGAQEWQLRGLAERAGYPCGLFVSMRSPYLPLPKKYEEVEAAVDGKFRQNLRRRKRRLAEQGEVKYVIVDGRDAKELDEALADFFTIEAGGWKGQSGTAIAQRPDLVGFYTQVARDAAKRKELMLGFLELANKRIAGHMKTTAFVPFWSTGKDSFLSDPPNADVSILEGDQLRQMVEKQSELVRSKYHVDVVGFRVDVVDGKVKLKAKPIFIH